jgi:hypothetical protein
MLPLFTACTCFRDRNCICFSQGMLRLRNNEFMWEKGGHTFENTAHPLEDDWTLKDYRVCETTPPFPGNKAPKKLKQCLGRMLHSWQLWVFLYESWSPRRKACFVLIDPAFCSCKLYLSTATPRASHINTCVLMSRPSTLEAQGGGEPKPRLIWAWNHDRILLEI